LGYKLASFPFASSGSPLEYLQRYPIVKHTGASREAGFGVKAPRGPGDDRYPNGVTLIGAFQGVYYIDNWKNLDRQRGPLLRIGGFNASFADLPKEAKDEIIERTEHCGI